MIERNLGNISLFDHIPQKIVVISGARHIGKSSYLRKICSNKDQLQWLDGKRIDTRRLFDINKTARLDEILHQTQTLVLDEAERIPDLNNHITYILNHFPQIQIFIISNTIISLSASAPTLTCRFTPPSFKEMVQNNGLLNEKILLLHRLIEGYYPGILTLPKHAKRQFKMQILDDIYADVFRLEQIKKTSKFKMLLIVLAQSVGVSVSYSSLGKECDLNVATVQRYISLLEQCHIIFKVNAHHSNLSTEIKNITRIYFKDNGVLNTLLKNPSGKQLEVAIDGLWENFLVSERRKKMEMMNLDYKQYFWETFTNKRIDYIEEINGELIAFDFRWSVNTLHTPPNLFFRTYPNIKYKVIRLNNPEDLLLN